MTTAEGLDQALIPLSPAGAVRFLGKETAYWRLRIRGAALILITLGLYRFWFATDVRRYMWSSIEIGGETLEYAGLATELLGGFLVATAILVPLYAALAATALAFDRAEQETAAASLVLLVLLAQFALYRARRYRLTRTVFRGVRFGQHGSAWPYALLALAWWSLVAVTLGLAYPWAQAALQRYKMHHTSYGDLPGAFAGSAAALFWRGLPIWLLVVGPLVAAFFALGAMADWGALDAMMAGGETNPLALLVASAGMRVFAVGAAALGASMAAAVLLYPWFRAITLRWWLSGMRFGEVAAASRLRVGQVYRIYLRFLLAMLLFVAAAIVAGIVAALAAAAFGNGHATLAQLAGGTITLLFYVAVALGVSTLYQVMVNFALWRLCAQTAELSGAAALDAVRAAGSASSALGEGLADALGVGGV